MLYGLQLDRMFNSVFLTSLCGYIKCFYHSFPHNIIICWRSWNWVHVANFLPLLTLFQNTRPYMKDQSCEYLFFLFDALLTYSKPHFACVYTLLFNPFFHISWQFSSSLVYLSTWLGPGWCSLSLSDAFRIIKNNPRFNENHLKQNMNLNKRDFVTDQQGARWAGGATSCARLCSMLM